MKWRKKCVVSFWFSFCLNVLILYNKLACQFNGFDKLCLIPPGLHHFWILKDKTRFDIAYHVRVSTFLPNIRNSFSGKRVYWYCWNVTFGKYSPPPHQIFSHNITLPPQCLTISRIFVFCGKFCFWFTLDIKWTLSSRKINFWFVCPWNSFQKVWQSLGALRKNSVEP